MNSYVFAMSVEEKKRNYKKLFKTLSKKNFFFWPTAYRGRYGKVMIITMQYVCA